jgi:hypothetical protein
MSDGLTSLDVKLEWREHPNAPRLTSDAVRLWSGEVILRSGQGRASPFYADEAAAEAWVLATALACDPADVFEGQIVPYACVRQFAAGVLDAYETAVRALLRRYDVSPLRPWGAPIPVTLPGAQQVAGASISASPGGCQAASAYTIWRQG